MFYPEWTIAPGICSRGAVNILLETPCPPPPHRWIDHLRAPLAGMPSIVPALRAYSGLRVPDRSPVRTADTLGRLGSLEGRLARRRPGGRRAPNLPSTVF